ncbi:unnamed protein product [Orchesella dallaii]|uniref:F-box/LRR-repeat protein 18 LRR domain-containing protein n=1 Tax=Orchesella dallaii TaxID=48710 RepID=A0ABP1R798_9HEXA
MDPCGSNELSNASEDGNSSIGSARKVPHILEFGDETLLHMVQYLHGSDFDHGDLVNLALTCKRFESLLQDRSVSEVIKLIWSLKASRDALVGYLRQRNRTELVTKLHITDVYWVPSGVLRDAVVHMHNLKELLAAGARLSWVHLKEILTSLENVESLSWSWDSGLEESIRKKGSVSPVRFRELLDLKPKFLKLKNLLLHVPLAINVAPTDLIVCSFTSFVYLISLCQKLEQLWILSWPKTCQERKFSSNFFQEVFETDDIDLPNLKVLVVDVKEPPRIHIPRLILKLLKNFERNKISPKVLWLDDPLINKPCLSTRRGITLEDRIWPALDFSMMERFSLPLMSAALRNIPKPFPSCKALQISHGMPIIINLNGTVDGVTQLESLCVKAFNFKMDWKKLSLHHPNMKEINLSKNEGVSYPDYCVALAEMTKLKRISVPLETLVEIKDARVLAEFADCVPQNDTSTPIEPQSYTLGFKKRRIGVAISNKPAAGVSGLQLLTNRCSYVEEIEIGFSSKSCHAGRLLVDSLFYISQWKFLKKLSLDGVPIKHGKFLIEIAKSTSLEVIRLSNLGPTGRCAYIADITNAVRHCPQLKDLRLEQNYMGSVTPLLHALQNCSNLQRLLLWSSPNDTALDCEAVLSLFIKCKSLVVFYAVVEPTLKVVCKKLRKLLTVVFLSIWFFYDRFIDGRNLPPGPMRLPILGNLLQMGAKKKQIPAPHIMLQEFCKEFGPIVTLQYGMKRQVVIDDYDVIRQVLQSDVWLNRPTDKWMMERSFGKSLGILWGNSDSWREIRRFTIRTLRDFGFGKQTGQDAVMEEELTELMKRLDEKIELEGSEVYMSQFFTVSVLNILWSMMAGTRFSHEDAKLTKIVKHIYDNTRFINATGNILMAFPALRTMLRKLTGVGEARKQLIADMQKQFQDILDERRALKYYKDDQRDFIDVFLSEIDKHAGDNSIDNYYTDEQFVTVALDLFVAGMETTSNSLEFAMLYMILYPEVQKKVQQEILKEIGPTGFPTVIMKNSMPYTEATLLEIQRISSVAPMIVRSPITDTKILSYEIKKGTFTILNLYSSHMNPKIWEDPQDFRPERFLNESNEIINTEKMFPFGQGFSRL